jgi:hypothetical protein
LIRIKPINISKYTNISDKSPFPEPEEIEQLYPFEDEEFAVDVTISVTGSVNGEFTALSAVITILPLYVPAFKLAGFAITVMLDGVVPLVIDVLIQGILLCTVHINVLP